MSGVDSSKFLPNLSLKNSFKDNYNIDNDTLILLFMGRVTKDKGIYELLSLYEKLLNDNFKVKLVLAGLDEELIYLGHIENPDQIIPIADIFILLSKREGFGLSIIEASSCSIPIIANNIVGLRDSVSDNKTGILIDNFDNFRDYNKIKEIISDNNLRKNLGENGRLYVKKYFEKKDVINYLYSELINYI